MSVDNTHFGADTVARLMSHCESVFFVGIGGINMSSLALITKRRGKRVGGSDRCRSALTERLCDEGINVVYSHAADNIDGYDAVVYTVAISPQNPEYVAAHERNIPCISRADYMGYLMTGYVTRIGISGMHGKSTCTSMCAEMLIRAKADPTVLSGAELEIMNGAFVLGEKSNRLFVFEACEYMDSFLDFNPTVAVILNLERDHVDYFHSMEQIRQSYRKFASITGENGVLIVNADNADAMTATDGLPARLITFGSERETAYYRAVNQTEHGGKCEFDILRGGVFFLHASLSVFGRHNIYNALAACAVGDLCGLSAEDIAHGLSAFRGAKRRMEFKGKINGADVYDDYGHHPTEVFATLDGFSHAGYKRVFCVYQPHTYSRTAALLDDYRCAFMPAYKVFVLPVYAARETDNLGISNHSVAEIAGEKAVAVDSFEEAAKTLLSELRDRDAAVIMGAGDIEKIFDFTPLS